MESKVLGLVLKVRNLLRNEMHKKALGPQCQILIKPSFDDMICFNIDKLTHINHMRIEEGRNVYEVNKYIWKRNEDLKKHYNPVLRMITSEEITPTISKSSATIESEKLHDLLSSLKNIKVQVIPEMESFGLDGISYELLINEPYRKIRFEWWQDGPENWKKIVETTNKIINLIDRES